MRVVRRTCATPRSLASQRLPDALHVHALASMGDELLVGTGEGLFARNSSGAWRPQGLRGREIVDVQVGSDGALWVTTKPDPERANEQLFTSRDAGMA